MNVNRIADLAQLSCMLEVSAPKPGNVNKSFEFTDTRFIHFLASSIALGNSARRCAEKGFSAGKGEIALGEINIGWEILQCARESSQHHKGRNTNLGISILILPLASACGYLLGKSEELENEKIIGAVDHIIRESTYIDTINLYHAVRHVRPGGLKKLKGLDVFSHEALVRIEKEKINFYRIMKLSKNDEIAREVVNRYEITFNTGYPSIVKELEIGSDFDKAIIRGFFEILSRNPDTLIAKKVSMEKSREISEMAKKVMENDLAPEDIRGFDLYLRDEKNRLNPGSTADLVASSIFITLINGRRP